MEVLILKKKKKKNDMEVFRTIILLGLNLIVCIRDEVIGII